MKKRNVLMLLTAFIVAICLVGCGSSGKQGDPGQQGPKGDTGATGAQGPKGDTGATGAQGPKGDSVTVTAIEAPDAGLPDGASSEDAGSSDGGGCPYGGAALTVGDGGTTYVCNGAPGVPGPQGPQGPKGQQGVAGTAKAWAWVSASGTVVNQCNGCVASISIVKNGTGVYCIQTTPDILGNYGPILATLQGGDLSPGFINANNGWGSVCNPYGSKGIFTANASGTATDKAFVVVIP